MSNLKKGARIHCRLYGGRNGTISEVYGTPGEERVIQSSGGARIIHKGCAVDVVFDDGAYSRNLPENIVTGVQWRLLDEPIRSDDDVSRALNFAEETAENARKAMQAEKEKFEAEIQECRESDEYDFLVQMKAGDDSDSFASKNIKRYLKKLFPSVKFSVRKRDYDCIYVTWPKETDSEEINQRSITELLRIFKTGRYNAYEDYHDTESSPFNHVYGGVNYLICQRGH